ncbi:two-pore potassium channel 5 [Olea europaea subsp. europaea]|uniref:Two-pore potassium channel 5 n=1 Tax=Olea europaea subsp. europaea TaxID=158383 RepID=A0A8S0V7C8_OLEEU|nr:two-pore potassium channel 5 [Olea europaea subsp. europaea]
MEAEPSLASPQFPHDFTLKIPQSLNKNDIKIQSPVIYEDIEDALLSDDDFLHTVSPPPGPSSSFKRKKIQRCKTAPAMSAMKQPESDHAQNPDFESESVTLVRQAAVLLLIYLALGVVIYSFNRDNFSSVETHPVVDALYFCIVTMCTIGYGDIAPLTPVTKVFACVFVLVGFGFIDILLSGVVNYVLDLQESVILAGIQAPKQNQQKETGEIFCQGLHSGCG